MLTSKLNTVVQVGLEYMVFLDSDHKYYFANKRKASDFTTRLNGFINDTVIELNEIEKHLHCLYRDYMLYIGERFVRESINRQLNEFAGFIDSVYVHAGVNRNTFIYTSLVKAIDSGFMCLSALENVALKRSDTIVKHQISVKRFALSKIAERLELLSLTDKPELIYENLRIAI